MITSYFIDNEGTDVLTFIITQEQKHITFLKMLIAYIKQRC